MNSSNETAAGRLQTGVLAVAAVTMVALIVAYPSQAFSASLTGLTVWWKFVFPALLPFLILSEILLGLGAVRALGVMLDPLMRLLFRLPGAGGWVLAMSFTAGFPAGAKAAADLRRGGAVSKAEGNRLLSLSHLSSPVFIAVIIAAGFMGHPELGLPLFAIHLASAIAAGLLIRLLLFRSRTGHGPDDPPAKPSSSRGLAKVIDALLDAHHKDGRPFGRLLGDAVSAAVQASLVIGGLIIVFSVLLQLLQLAGIMDVAQMFISTLLLPLGMPPQLTDGLVMSLFEVHLGAYAIGRSGELSVWTAAVISAMIGFGGLSVHAQVKSLISGTDLAYTPFLVARLIHAAAAMLLTFVLWSPLKRLFSPESPAFAGAGHADAPAVYSSLLADGAHFYWMSLRTLGAFLTAALVLSAAVCLARRIARHISP